MLETQKKHFVFFLCVWTPPHYYWFSGLVCIWDNINGSAYFLKSLCCCWEKTPRCIHLISLLIHKAKPYQETEKKNITNHLFARLQPYHRVQESILRIHFFMYISCQLQAVETYEELLTCFIQQSHDLSDKRATYIKSKRDKNLSRPLAT